MTPTHPAMDAGLAFAYLGFMDPETKAYLDRTAETIVAQLVSYMDRRFEAVDRRFEEMEQRFAAVDARFDAIEERFIGIDERFIGIDERFIGIDERFRSLELRIQQFETRVMDRLDALEAWSKRAEHRLGALEKQMLGMNTRMDGLSEDMRQRFRVLNDRVGGIERRLVA